ncbi:MAG TPA: serine hydrolase domain-containing protein [Candidatus Saccharimonadales bacterium]|nr:serine hydrolase domain-containing protein [Candidatus Saccharimonadales bacterium]
MATMQSALEERARRAITERLFPGCVIGIVQKDGTRTIMPAGTFTYEPYSSPVTADSIFDVASITKVIPTASLALTLLDSGTLTLDDKLITYVPEFHNAARDQVRIRHLLTQTLDYDFRLSEYKDRSPQEILDVICSTEFISEPGAKFFYTNATSILLGLVVERVFGALLPQLGQEHFFGPLGMQRTGFTPLARFDKNEILPSEIQEWRGGVIQGEVHDESAYALQPLLTAGAAGLFSTVPDLLHFMEMLLHDGVSQGKRYFSSEILRQVHTNQLADVGVSMGLGWELNQPHWMGASCRQTTFGKTGFTGCNVVCDPEREVAWVILSNTTYPHRPANIDALNRFRADIADIILAGS